MKRIQKQVTGAGSSAPSPSAQPGAAPHHAAGPGGASAAAGTAGDGLASLTGPEEIAAYLQQEREQLICRLLCPPEQPVTPAGRRGLEVAAELTALTDRVIRRLFTLSCRAAAVSEANLPIAIVATGGYGRRELAPFSDVDISFVPARDGDPAIDAVIREMFRRLMDIFLARSGLEVGYSYRLIEDCGKLDTKTTSGLMDARLIAGSDRVFLTFEDAFWASFNATELIFSKLGERRAALAKPGREPRSVEPDLKEGAGGLRDLQTAVWLIAARHHLPAAEVRGLRGLEALARHVPLPPRELAGLAAARGMVMETRATLHAAARAARDVLVVTRQEEVGAAMGYAAREGEPPPVERIMADLYPCMETIRRCATWTADLVENGRLILSIGLDSERRQITPANESLDAEDPAWLLWAAEVAQRFDLGWSAALEQKAGALAATSPQLEDSQSANQAFTRILSRLGRVYPSLQKLADLGVLDWFVPEFRGAMNLIPYDPAHDYTVGQHTLLVIRELEALLQSRETDPEQQIEMGRILAELPHPEQLMLAALLHDCGKTDAERPHDVLGAELAAAVCRRLAWPADATANVCFLVRHHLLMAEISRLRDISLDETVDDFLKAVDDPDRLNMLYLLTYADTRAVGAGVWTQVKGHFLRELWRRAISAISSEETGPDEARARAVARRSLLRDLTLQQFPPDEVAEHIDAMPPNYLLSHPPNRIAQHIEFVRRARSGSVVVDFRDEPAATYTEVTVCAVDLPLPGLLARLTGALHALGVAVHAAQVTTRVAAADNIALDLLWVDFRGKRLSPGKQREVAAALTQSVKRPEPEAQPGPGAPAPEVRSVRTDLSQRYTVIEIGAADQQSALHRAAAALARLGWSILSARVSEWQGEIRSVFYVSGIPDLPPEEASRLLQRELLR